jgi:hypothetical protein
MLTFLHLQFVPGPGPDSLTVINFQNLAWDLRYTVITTQPVVAPKLPLPGPPLNLQATRAGPLLQSVGSCSSLQVSDGIM